MTNFANKFSLTFLFLLLLSNFLHASDILVPNCQLLKIKTNQIFISEDGYYVIDEKSNALIAVDGFIKLNNATFAFLSFVHSDLEAGRRVFGDTWQCPVCGYENYESIHTCAVCGTEKLK